MEISGNQRWLRTAMLLGIVYLLVGIAFAVPAAAAASAQTRVVWRLAAWVVSGIAFGAHILYEHLRMRHPPVKAAFHAAMAAAMGAFGLAVAANLHAPQSASSRQRSLLLLALALWPALTAIPAFLVALAAAGVLARTRRGA